MNCQQTEEIIQAYVDGELDLHRSLELERHLSECLACSRSRREHESLHAALAGSRMYFPAPRGLETRVCSALRQANRVERGAQRSANRWRWPWPARLAPLAAAAVALLLAWPLATRQAAENRLAEEILSAHVRSLMLEHKTDVASSDQHTVKPWFDGKLDFAPPVVDLAGHGFPLVGGRLDYIQGRPVAALVYQRRKHFINLFIWPASKSVSTAKSVAALRGYNELHWEASGMCFWAVSDLNSSELAEFGQFIK